jgi:hypothetical protein
MMDQHRDRVLHELAKIRQWMDVLENAYRQIDEALDRIQTSGPLVEQRDIADELEKIRERLVHIFGGRWQDQDQAAAGFVH